MSKRFLSFWVLSIMFIACAINKPNHRIGVVDFKMVFYDTIISQWVYAQYEIPRSRYWCKDSMVIAETIGASVSYQGASSDQFSDTMRFTFINLKTKEYYRYRHFSDTARLIKSFIGPDPLSPDGSWNFFQNKRLYHIDTLKPSLSDTFILGRKYKRISIIGSHDGGLKNPYGTAYLNCQTKLDLFQFDRQLVKW